MPAGLSSTLIHFDPLLTTTSPCGQYFFFVLFAPSPINGFIRQSHKLPQIPTNPKILAHKKRESV